MLTYQMKKGLDVVVVIQFLHFFSECEWRGMLINTSIHTDKKILDINLKRDYIPHHIHPGIKTYQKQKVVIN